MSQRKHLSHLSMLTVACVLVLSMAAGSALAQTPLSCSGGVQAYGVLGVDAEFFEVPGNLNFTSLCSPSPAEELNNVCYRSTDGLLYAVQLTSGGNSGVVTVDGACSVSTALTLTGATLPSNVRFDAGDCLPDGSQMLINQAGDRNEFYALDLSSLSVSQMTTDIMTWDTGIVNDWAYNPNDGKLYGGDRSDGELAVVTLSPDPSSPTSAQRDDLTITGLPSSSSATGAYGGAWFNTELDRLFLYRNNGVIYEIDISGPMVVATHTGTIPSPNIPSSTRNDSAACVCDQAYFTQNINADVFQCDPSTPALNCQEVCSDLGIEINNLGFRKEDWLLYAVKLTGGGNAGLVRTDPKDGCSSIETQTVTHLPTNKRFDAGDITPDGSTLYVNFQGDSPLYIVDLTTWTSLTATSKPITGATGTVHDWAYNPEDGKLYGGDNTDGEVAVLTIDSDVSRADFAVTSLPPGTAFGDAAFGGAWFNADGHLVLHDNDGNVYEIDISGPTHLSTTSANSSTRNDGAVCVQ